MILLLLHRGCAESGVSLRSNKDFLLQSDNTISFIFVTCVGWRGRGVTALIGAPIGALHET